jgi:hypothetical protein
MMREEEKERKRKICNEKNNTKKENNINDLFRTIFRRIK